MSGGNRFCSKPSEQIEDKFDLSSLLMSLVLQLLRLHMLFLCFDSFSLYFIGLCFCCVDRLLRSIHSLLILHSYKFSFCLTSHLFGCILIGSNNSCIIISWRLCESTDRKTDYFAMIRSTYTVRDLTRLIFTRCRDADNK